MIVTLDIGESNDLHPQNKKEVGIRLAKAAGYLIYNETDTHSGPLPKRAIVVGRIAEISFQYLEDMEAETSLNNFEVAGLDGIFHPATAVRKGRNVFISCDRVDVPSSVKYAMCDNPTNINFYNDADLPAPGFRMDL
jgi:sialate O-acetylesterase